MNRYSSRNRKKTAKAIETTMPPNRFTKATEAYKIMEGLFDDGTVGPDTAPGDLYKGQYSKIFQQYSDSVFRTHFNKMKAEKGVLLRKDDGKKTVAEGIADAIKKPSGQANQNTQVWDPTDRDTSFTGEAKLAEGALWLYSDNEPTDPFVTPANLKKDDEDEGIPMILPCVAATIDDSDSAKKRAVIATHMPSGIVDPSNWKTEVVGDGNYLRFNVQQHQTMTNPMVLSMAIPDEIDPTLQIFAQNAINAKIREMCGGKRKELMYTFKKKLDFKCEQQIVFEQPATFGGCTFLLVVLQAVEQDSWNLQNKSNNLVDLDAKIAKMKAKGL